MFCSETFAIFFYLFTIHLNECKYFIILFINNDNYMFYNGIFVIFIYLLYI